MDPYATHQPVLVKALVETQKLFPLKPILECGCGDYSTPLIRTLKGLRRHEIMSADPDWYEQYKDEVSAILHVEFQGVHHWADVEFKDGYGLCLMDSEEYVANRVQRIPQLLDRCDVVIMHDAHIQPEAAYSFLYTRYFPATWIGSKHVNVESWFK